MAKTRNYLVLARPQGPLCTVDDIKVVHACNSTGDLAHVRELFLVHWRGDLRASLQRVFPDEAFIVVKIVEAKDNWEAI